ncbi:hypothetical protein SJAG_01027 [Schizosaccharomyces japonicus yFS275]|uniref:Protein transport protein SFT2 n=1 Tax=Schizosaccharomyces japonicus (strain yFS275 / FY16936) TaxID=402676 RepID=B6JXA3_SCHJY|nr:hypothetical protein SJAG_01027 [Schizosaccharomyces japonicus yFS275]EEB06004.1 hypothetical protein SJAG_01027 [Schizosaccharomyces japonicus yFS275]
MEQSFSDRVRSVLGENSSTPAETGDGWFSRFRQSLPWADGYTAVPTTTNSDSDALFNRSDFTLSRWERILLFALCLIGSITCYTVACFMFPTLVLRPRKFILLWTYGSILCVLAFAILIGFKAHFVQLVSSERLPTTLAYFLTLACTLVSTVKLHSTILSIVFGVMHLLALIAYIVAFFPFGARTVSLGSRIASRSLSNWLP